MTDKQTYRGISVIICCYNSIGRIGETLLALSRQEFTIFLEWELIIVDNASTDGIEHVAVQYWEALKTGVPLKVVHEPRQGLMHARNKGISASSFSLLLFCDDDNHLMPGYLQRIYINLKNNPKVAACGGRGIPKFETNKPSWFDSFQEAYAVGSQLANNESGKITNLYGAGLGVKKSVLKELNSCGFRPISTGREGKKLSSADDTELTYAMVIRGYTLLYDDDLIFHHFLSAARLQYSYIEKLMTSFGNDGPLRNLYFAYISQSNIHRSLKNYYFHCILCILRTLKYLVIPPKPMARKIYLKWNIRYLISLLSIKNNYAFYKENIEKLIPPATPVVFIHSHPQHTIA
jgi:glycosyltransferase involved in cell wall biosynthesis